MTRIVHLTTVHRPFDTRVFWRECVSLARAGYDVTLVVPHPRDEEVSGVRIAGLPRPRNRRDRATRIALAGWRRVVALRPHLVHVHDPELMPLAVLLKCRGFKVVLDVHENMAKQMAGKSYLPLWLRPWLAAAVGVLERLVDGLLDGVVAATPQIAARHRSGRTALVQNFPDMNEFAGPAAPYAGREPIVAYVGGLSRGRGLFTMIEAIRILAARRRVRLCLAGRGDAAELAAARAQAANLPVEFLGMLNRREVADLLGHARVGLVVLDPLPNYLESQPVKMFEYMAAALPVIASDFPVWRELIGAADCAVFVPPTDAPSLARALAGVLDDSARAVDMGRRGLAAARERFSWQAEVPALLELYRGVLAPPSPRAKSCA